MFVRVTANRRSGSNSLVNLGMTSGSNPIASLIERTYKRETEILGEKVPAEYVYQAKTGAVRSYKLLSDGRRQIGAFHLVGDIFGLENNNVHRFTAEAVVETTLRLINRRNLDAIAESDTVVTRNLISMATASLEHAENHMLLLGRKNSLERVAAFLLEMDDRLSPTGMIMKAPNVPSGHRRLSRPDVGDCISSIVLNFTGQTHREIVIRDRVRLASFDLPA
jgi:CRP/FNR family nitrogen fixation transcriptional regulator